MPMIDLETRPSNAGGTGKVPGSNGSNEVEPGMVKWLHLVEDYGHLFHSPIEWLPVPFNRCINVSCEPFEGELDRSESAEH